MLKTTHDKNCKTCTYFKVHGIVEQDRFVFCSRKKRHSGTCGAIKNVKDWNTVYCNYHILKIIENNEKDYLQASS